MILTLQQLLTMIATACGLAETLIAIDPSNNVAQSCLSRRANHSPPSSPSPLAVSRPATPTPATPKPAAPPTIESPAYNFEAPTRKFVSSVRMTAEETNLVDGYRDLLERANLLGMEISSVLAHYDLALPGHDDAVAKLACIAKGNVTNALGAEQNKSARQLAKELKAADPSLHRELIVQDFEATAMWLKSRNDSNATPDLLRQRILQRKQVLDALLPQSTESLTAAALAHVERQFVQRRYNNDETILGDAIADIPAANFFVSEDNYAFDMEELAQCLAANSGVLRNPYSREMFSAADVRAILAHPLGAPLGRLAQGQEQMKQGVRSETIKWVGRLGKILLEDQSLDLAPSRPAMDEFLAYVALLPAAEQKTIEELRIPAKDSLNGQKFDSTIGQAVQDAKANMTCVHKVSTPQVHVR
jgi:hypothetical protein